MGCGHHTVMWPPPAPAVADGAHAPAPAAMSACSPENDGLICWQIACYRKTKGRLQPLSSADLAVADGAHAPAPAAMSACRFRQQGDAVSVRGGQRC